MIENIKIIIKKTFIYGLVIKYRQMFGVNRLKDIRDEINSDVYHHDIMHDTIINLSKQYGVENFVETGTYTGNTIYGVKDSFKNIYSVELSKEIFDLVRSRFERYDHIRIFNGDSSDMLEKIAGLLSGPAIFWLDAHYSSGGTSKGELHTPIFKELITIFRLKCNGNIVLIDDMKDFNGMNDYPTVMELKEFIEDNSNYSFEIKGDVAYLFNQGI